MPAMEIFFKALCYVILTLFLAYLVLGPIRRTSKMILNFIKALILWLIVPTNRQMAFDFIIQGIELAKKGQKFLKSNQVKIDPKKAGADHLAKIATQITDKLPEDQAQVFVKQVNQVDIGPLKTVNLALGPQGVSSAITLGNTIITGGIDLKTGSWSGSAGFKL